MSGPPESTSALDQIRRQVDDRLRELEPLVAEYEQLMAIRSNLDAVPSTPAAPRTGRRRARPAAAKDGATGPRGTRTLELVREEPGLTAAELAERMGIKRNYLYRVMPRLQDQGQVLKRGDRYYPA